MRDPSMLILMVALTVGFLIWHRYSARLAAERRRQLESWATARGWRYRPADAALAHRWNGPPFTGGGQTSDVFSGDLDGRSFTAFQYSYEEGSGDNSVTRHFLVTAVRLPAPLPMLWIAPETAFGRLARRIGSQDIDFESAEFNRTFVVRADDERYAHAMIHPRMMEYLLRSPAREHSLRIEGDTLLMWQPGTMTTDRLLVATGTLTHLAGLIPSHALDQHAIAPSLAAAGRPPSYAGSVTGLRPEPTLRGLLGPIGLALWGLFWSVLTLPLAVVVISLMVGNRARPAGAAEWAGAAGAGLVWLIGLVAFGFGLTKLIRGLLAIRLNKRDRERRIAAATNPVKPPAN